MTRITISAAALALALAAFGCASSVDTLAGLPARARHRPPPQLKCPPPARLPSALKDPAAAPTSPDARPTPAASPRVASLPRGGWQRGAMSFHLAMGLRHRRRIPVMVLYRRPGCPYSRAFQQLYLTDPAFIRGTSRIVKVMVNTRGSAADQALTVKQKITGTPTLLVYPGRGGRPREVVVFYRVGPQIRRKPVAQVLSEIRRITGR